MTPLLSILVLTVPARKRTFFPAILDGLEAQAEGKRVEILGLYDNKANSVGAKRNALLQTSAGMWVTFVDDDDDVASIYVDTLLLAIADVVASGRPLTTQVIVFDQQVVVNGSRPKLCKYGLEFAYVDGPKIWTGKPAHTQCWRASWAKQHAFPTTNYGEDATWVAKACAGLTSEQQYRIEGPPLYTYHYRRAVSETREGQSQPATPRY
jgi:hypothetical protein